MQGSLAVTIVFARRKAKLDEVFERIQEFRWIVVGGKPSPSVYWLIGSSALAPLAVRKPEPANASPPLLNIRARHQSITSPGPQSKLFPKNLHPRPQPFPAEYWCLGRNFVTGTKVSSHTGRAGAATGSKGQSPRKHLKPFGIAWNGVFGAEYGYLT